MTHKYAIGAKSSRNSDDDDDIKQGFPLIDMQKKPYQHYEQVFTAQHIHFYLSEGIGEPHRYTDMVHRIAVAGPSDTVFIHLNTPGGQLDTGVQLINAMQNSQAKIITILESQAYSLGTLLFLAGDEMVVNDHCMMMFHNFNGGLIGKGNEMTSQLDATVKWFASLARQIYIPFLSEDEFNRISRGEDMWMQSAEIRARLENMMQVLDAEAQEAANPKPKKQAKPKVPKAKAKAAEKKPTSKPRKTTPKTEDVEG